MTVEIETSAVEWSGCVWGVRADVVFYDAHGVYLPVTDAYPRPSDEEIDEDPPSSEGYT